MTLSEYFAGNMADCLKSTEPALLEKAAIEDWIYGRARPLERMSALECGSRLANFRSGWIRLIRSVEGFPPDFSRQRIAVIKVLDIPVMRGKSSTRFWLSRLAKIRHYHSCR